MTEDWRQNINLLTFTVLSNYFKCNRKVHCLTNLTSYINDFSNDVLPPKILRSIYNDDIEITFTWTKRQVILYSYKKFSAWKSVKQAEALKLNPPVKHMANLTEKWLLRPSIQSTFCQSDVSHSLTHTLGFVELKKCTYHKKCPLWELNPLKLTYHESSMQKEPFVLLVF